MLEQACFGANGIDIKREACREDSRAACNGQQYVVLTRAIDDSFNVHGPMLSELEAFDFVSDRGLECGEDCAIELLQGIDALSSLLGRLGPLAHAAALCACMGMIVTIATVVTRDLALGRLSVSQEER